MSALEEYRPKDDPWEHCERQFAAELAVGDGRTLEGRIVPYNVAARVADPPTFEPYDEMFLPGAFRAQLNAAHRIKVFLNFEHEQGIGGIIGSASGIYEAGRASGLYDSDDGLYGTFRMVKGANGDTALDLVNEGLLTGMSLEFSSKYHPSVDGVRQRVDCRVDRVSLCRFPAYKDAQVLAVREEPEVALLEPTVSVLSSDIDEIAAARGIERLDYRMAVTSKPWDGSAARFTDEQYLKSCLIVRPGDAPAKERGSLPVLEPDGTLNTNALAAAAGRLTQVSGVSAADKATAAGKLVRYYGMAKMKPPASVMMMAAK
jgi:HK97 family phage prohead protease